MRYVRAALGIAALYAVTAAAVLWIIIGVLEDRA